jgi:signal transduction histidine kinase
VQDVDTPIVAARERERGLRTLRRIAYVGLVGSAASTAAWLVAGDQASVFREFHLLFAAVFIGVLGLVRRGRLLEGSVLFVGVVMAGIGYLALARGHLVAPVLGALVVTVMVAAVLLGPRGALVVAGLAIAETSALWLWVGPGEMARPGEALTAWLPLLIAMGGVAWVAATEIRVSIADAARSEAETGRRAAVARAILDATPLGVFQVDRDRVVRDANREALRMVGAPSEEGFLGRSVDELPAMRVPEVAEALDAALVRGERGRAEASWTSAFGIPIEARLLTAPIVGKDGRPLGAVSVQEDLSDLLAMNARLLQSQKMEALGRLSGGLAHDFNNYLMVIMAGAERVRRSLPGDHELGPALDQILQAAESAGALTHALLAYSRKQVFQPQVVDPNALVSGFAPVLEASLGSAIRLELSLAEDAGSVRVDPGQMEAVLLNLAANARDAMPDGGVLRIEAAREDLDGDGAAELGLEPGPHLLLEVTDDGVGMDEATRLRAFDPFFTTQEEGRGTGLGLASVEGIVVQSGGAISVDSAPGEGCRFRIRLPSVQETPETPPQSSPAGRGELVLLVDDEPEVRELTRDALVAAGYRVIAAADGDEALKRAADHRDELALVLSDLVMPGVGGAGLGPALKRLAPGVPLVFMTGFAEHRDAEVARRTGHAVLLKPFNTPRLLAQVRAALDARP